MSSSATISKQIEDVLVTHRRGFLKSAGLLAVSFGVFGRSAMAEADDAQSNGLFSDRLPITIPISTKSTRGS